MNSGEPLNAQPVDPADMSRSIDEYVPEDGPLISADALHSAIKRDFLKSPIWHTALLLLLQIVFVTLAVILALVCVLKLGNLEQCQKILDDVTGTNVIALGKACMWVAVQLYTLYSEHHHSGARKRGYLQFYRQTSLLKNLPLSVHSAGTVAFLVFQAVGFQWSPTLGIYLIIGVLVVELFLVVPFLLCIIVTVWKHNSRRPAPDVCEDEHSQSITGRPMETGFREGSSLEEVVEKQSDLIEYLMEHNRALSKRLLNLTAQH